MAAVVPADQATDLLQQLSLNEKAKKHDAPEVTTKYGATNSGQCTKFQVPSLDRSMTPVLSEYMNHNMCFMPNGYPSTSFYYGGYDGSTGEWDDYTYMSPEGMEMPHGNYADVYNHGYNYASYGTYCSGSSIPAMGHVSQLYGAQHYQYTSPYFQPHASANAMFSSNHIPSSQGDVGPIATNQTCVTIDSTKPNSQGVVTNVIANGNSASMSSKQVQQNSSLTCNGSYGRGVLPGGHLSSWYHDLRFSSDGMQSPISWFDGPALHSSNLGATTTNIVSTTASQNVNTTSARNPNVGPIPHFMNMHSSGKTNVMELAAPGVMNRMYPTNRMYDQFGNTFRAGVNYGSQVYDYRMNTHWGMSADGKYKPRANVYGFYGHVNENLDGLSELSKGPRANHLRNQNGNMPTVLAEAEGQYPNIVPDRQHYNRADFCDKYTDAKFFVIKSYSEDDVHKSIKYNVWASTPNGNKKLDAAYKETLEKGDRCPVFLYFSVNTSGQFVGVAEMVGPVDFNKTVDFWQQDKWIGCFDVKWHIIKDVPNSMLKHITLEYNDNKPVTNSRDTQEVKLEQGLQMLKIFKEHVSKTSILDDFVFYEHRQKALLEKRCRPQLHNQMADIKPADPVGEKGKDGGSVNNRLQKALEPVKILKKDVIPAILKQADDNALLVVGGDAPRGSKPATDVTPIANCVAN